MNRVDLMMWKLSSSVLVSSYSLFGYFYFRKMHFSYAHLYVLVNTLFVFKQNIFYRVVIIFLIVRYALLSNSIQERKQSHMIFMRSQIHWITDLKN